MILLRKFPFLIPIGLKFGQTLVASYVYCQLNYFSSRDLPGMERKFHLNVKLNVEKIIGLMMCAFAYSKLQVAIN